MIKILLASNSPRRKTLLSKYYDNFDVVSIDADENIKFKSPSKTAVAIAKRKMRGAKNYFSKYDIIITADTLVYCKGCYFGKPKDRDDAIRILMELQGQTHTVVTGVCLRFNGNMYDFSDKSKVRFKPLNLSEIQHYVDNHNVYDKAGSYAIQDNFIVESYHGDYDNIVGLPIDKLHDYINKLILIT